MSQRKVDPISLLRDAYTTNSKISLVDGLLVFNSQIKLPIDTPTAWMPPDNIKRYNVGDLWFFLDSRGTDPSAYYQRVSEFKGKLQMVSMQHQSKIKRGNRRVLYREEGLL